VKVRRHLVRRRHDAERSDDQDDPKAEREKIEENPEIKQEDSPGSA